MTKQATVELLKQQLPGFYSVEQVISIVSGIDDEQPQLFKFDETKLEEIRDKIVSNVYDKVGDALSDMYDDELVDTSSAEFSLNGNEIQLDSVDVDKDNISDKVSDVCGDVVRDVLEKYITLSK